MAKYKVVAKKSKLPELKKTYDPRSKYDWMGAQKDYINGIQDDDGTYVYPTNAQLCEKYGIPSTSLANRISKERWPDHRRAVEKELLLARQKERAKLLAKKAVIFDETAANGSQLAQQLITERLQDLVDFQAADRTRIEEVKTRMELGETVPDYERKSTFSHNEVSELAKAFALFNEVGRKALGMTDDEGNNTTIEVTHVTNVGEELRRSDDQRAADLLRVLGNPNLIIPGYNEPVQEGDVIDAEFTEQNEITDGSE